MLRLSQRRELMEKLRVSTGKILYEIIRVKRDYTAREICGQIDMDPARISEIFAAKPNPKKPFSEKTLRKLIGGGFVRVKALLEKTELNAEEEEFLKKFLVYEDPTIVSSVEFLRLTGYDVGSLLLQMVRLAKIGIDLKETLKNIEKVSK